jgi:hypothetical protein
MSPPSSEPLATGRNLVRVGDLSLGGDDREKAGTETQRDK